MIGRRVIPALGLVACVAVGVETLLLWDATGRVMLTRLPMPADETAATERDDLEQLFAGTGLEAETGPMPAIATGFRLGLLPAGPGRDAVSVATLAGPVLVAALAIGLGGSIRREAGRYPMKGGGARRPPASTS